jgi:hypothetical protein
MTVRSPLYWDGSALREMSTSQVNEIVNRAVYVYGSNPSVSVTVVGSGGNISPNMTDTRLKSGTAATSATSYPSEATTGEPQTVTITFDKISQSITSVGAPTDTNSKLYPVYYDGSNIRAMSRADTFDTFVSPAINTLVDGNDRPGTFRIHTSTSLSNHSLQSNTPVFTDTRANTSLYLAGNIGTSGTTQDFSQTITNYYLFRTNQSIMSAPSFTAPLQIDGSNNLQQYSSSTLDSFLLGILRYYTSSVTGSRIRYSVNGSGNNRGSAMVNTKLNGNGNYQTHFVNANDYRAQEFPNGTAVTVSTWRLRVYRT